MGSTSHLIAELDPDVNNAKVAFKDLLRKYLREKPSDDPFDYFHDATLKLTDVCRKHLLPPTLSPQE
jgi:hypothetical protein